MENWEAEITITSGDLKPVKVIFGLHEKGTEDFDRGLDELAPPVPPTPPPLDAHFLSAGRFARKSKDIKPLVDPKPWKLIIITEEAAEIEWDLSHVPEEVVLLLGFSDLRKIRVTRLPKGKSELAITASTCLTATFRLHPGWNVIYCPGVACDPLAEITIAPILPKVYMWDPLAQGYEEVAVLIPGVYWFASESATELILRHT